MVLQQEGKMACVARNYEKTKDNKSIAESKPDEQEQPDSCSSLFEDFATSTSAHGIGKIYAAKSHFGRVLWILSVCFVYGVMLWMSTQLLLRYLSKPVISRVEVTQEESLAFPAVTICNQNALMKKYTKINAKKLYDLMEKYTNVSRTTANATTSVSERSADVRRNADEPQTTAQTTTSFAKIVKKLRKKEKQRRKTANDTTGNTGQETKTGWKKGELKNVIVQEKKSEIPTRKREYRKSKKNTASRKLHKLFENATVDEETALAHLAELVMRQMPPEQLRPLGHALDELVVDCKWSGFKCNSGSLKNLWTNFWHWKYGNCYTFNAGILADGEKYPPLNVDKPGPYNGLELLIDVKQNQYMSLTDQAGVRVVLTDQGKMPFPFDEGFSVSPGFFTSVGIRRVNTRRVDPFGNNSCIGDEDKFSKENIYKMMFKVDYSVLTCRKSCLAIKQRRKCNCTETRFPLNGTSPCQIGEQQKCADEVFSIYQKKATECAKSCPEPCLENQFRYTISNSKWSRQYSDRMSSSYRHRFGEDPSALGNNYLKLSIFYEHLSLERIIYEEAYPLPNLLADFGGQLGLWIGLSVLTVGEIIELLYKLVTVPCKKRTNNRHISNICNNSSHEESHM